jgi:hypothetical protein
MMALWNLSNATKKKFPEILEFSTTGTQQGPPAK